MPAGLLGANELCIWLNYIRKGAERPRIIMAGLKNLRSEVLSVESALAAIVRCTGSFAVRVAATKAIMS